MKFYLTTDLEKALQFDDRTDAHEIKDKYEAERKSIAKVCYSSRGFVVRCYNEKGSFEGWVK